MWRGVFSTVYHLENAEMTPELQDDLMNFSFDNLRDVFENHHIQNPDKYYNLCYFAPSLLECLKKLVCHHSCSSVLQILTHAQFSDPAILRSRSYLLDFSS
jgi:hypothetical protein